jgi:hypothetical protein
MDISNKPDQSDNKPSHFMNIWGRNETRLSALIAQTILLSQKFRRFIACELHMGNKSFEITSIKTEHYFEDKKEEQKNKIDVLIKCPDGLLIGIENKKWALLQGYDQLIRYDKLLNEESNGHYRLVFLAPSTYKLPDNSRPKNPKNPMTRIDYKKISNWIVNESFYSKFEKDYVEQFRLYLDALELENHPFTRQEISDLKEGKPAAVKKLSWIVDSIKPDKARFNQSADLGYCSYRLEVSRFPVLVGFRYKYKPDNYWFREPLLHNEPECLIYIYDDWKGSERDEMNQRVARVADKFNKNVLKHKAVFHDIEKKNECRLSIRKPLLDFEGKEISEIVLWFEENLNLLKKGIEEVINDET